MAQPVAESRRSTKVPSYRNDRTPSQQGTARLVPTEYPYPRVNQNAVARPSRILANPRIVVTRESEYEDQDDEDYWRMAEEHTEDTEYPWYE